MAGFTDLPEEIALYILQNVCHGALANEKYRLLFVNRQFSRLSLPLLYRNLHFDRKEEEEKQLSSFMLLTTLLLNSSKAEFVHSIEFNGDEFGSGAILESTDELTNYPGPLQKDIDDLLDAIDKHTGENGAQRKWWRHGLLEELFMPVLLALVVARLPNLSRFQFMDIGREFWDSFHRAVHDLQQVSGNSSIALVGSKLFPSLESVQIGGNASEYPHSPIPLTLFAEIPSVKRICGYQIGDGDETESVDHEPIIMVMRPRSNNIAHMSFRPMSHLLGGHMIRIVGSSRALETFDYYHGHSACWIPTSLPSLSSALMQQQSTLRSITLHVDDFTLDSAEEDSDWTPMQFGSYTALEHLNIAYNFLFRADAEAPEINEKAIPSCIQVLEIVQCSSKEEETIVEDVFDFMLKHKEDKWKNLKKLLIAVSNESDPISSEPAWMDLQARAEAKNVELVMTTWRTDYTTGIRLGTDDQDEGDCEEDEDSD